MKIIHIQQYVAGGFIDEATITGQEKRYGQRVKKVYATIPISKIWEQELSAASGTSLVIGTEKHMFHDLHTN